MVRHGRAEARAVFARTTRADAERPLTDDGRRRTRRVARGLAGQIAALERIATSPYTRARQTADLLAERFDTPAEPVEALVPGAAPESFLLWLQEVPEEACVAAVGHEPGLGRLACWFLTGRGCPALPLKKAGACLLRFRGDPGPGRADLRWLLTPKQLRQLAD